MTVPETNTAAQQQARDEYRTAVQKFESAFVRVPFEQFRRAFRTEMRLVEKEVPGLEALINKHAGRGPFPENVRNALQTRVTALQEKFVQCREESLRFRGRFLRRLKWIESMTDRGSYRSWARARLLRLVGDYLIRTGDLGAAKRLLVKDSASEEQQDSVLKVEDCLDIELAELRETIVQRLEAHSLDEALAWCADYRPNLKKLNSDLEFRLRQQEFIELLREGQLAEAVKAGQKNLAPWSETCYEGVKESMALLCWFPFLGRSVEWSNTRVCKYEALVSAEHWGVLREQFCRDFDLVFGIAGAPQLASAVEMGLAVLKTRRCVEGCSQDAFRTELERQCPSCNGPLGQLAASLPFGHYEMSRLLCRLSGLAMDADNPPLALPNGQVYSTAALHKMASESVDKQTVQCPVSGESFKLADARKCFIL